MSTLSRKEEPIVNTHLHRYEAIFCAMTTDHTTPVPLTTLRIARDFVHRKRTNRSTMEELSLVKNRLPHWLEELQLTFAIES